MNEVLGFVLAWALRAAGVGLIGLVAATWLRRRSGAARHFVWRASLAVMLAVPVFMSAGPRLSAKVPSSPRLDQTLRSSAALPSALTTLRLAKIDSKLYQPMDPDSLIDPSTIVFAIYMLGVAVVLRKWVKSLVSVNAMARLGEELPGRQIPGISVKFATRPDLTVPITYGWLKPVILLPIEAHDWPESRLNAALLHEQAHIARADWLWISVAQWLQAIQWFNPAVWLCCEGLRASAEDAADDQVLASGVASLVYASELLSVAEASSGHVAPGLAMARQAGLKSRLSRIMAENRDRTNPTKRLIAGLCTGLGLCGFVLSAAQIAVAASPHLQLPRVLTTLGRTQVTEPNVQKLPTAGDVSIAFLVSREPNAKPWLKDGSPGGTDDYKVFTTGEHSNLWSMSGLKGDRMLAVSVKVTDYSSQIVSVRGRFDGQPIGSSLGFTDLPGPHAVSRQWLAFSAPSTQKVGTIDVGVACSPYKVVASGKIGYGPLEAVATDRVKSESGMYDPVTKKPVIVDHYDTSHTQATVKVRVPPGYSDKDLTLAAFDAAGREFQTGEYMLPTITVNGRDYTQADFSVDDPQEIARVELRARDFEWVTFHNVQLYPGKG